MLEKFRIIPRNWPEQLTGRMELPFSEEGKILGGADWWGRLGIRWP